MSNYWYWYLDIIIKNKKIKLDNIVFKLKINLLVIVVI